MRGLGRFSQVIRRLSTNVNKGAAPSAPVDPLKNVTGEVFNDVYCQNFFIKFPQIFQD